MYRIGEFSQITHLTIKALRYYDEVGILKPSLVLDNGYRFYNEEDFQRAMQIQLLKSLNFSINEIKDVFTNVVDENDLQDYLLEKKLMIEKQMRNEKKIIQMINTYLKPPADKQGHQFQYEISIETTQEQLIACISFQENYANCSEYFAKLFKVAKSKVCYAPFNLYYDTDFKEKAIIEACVPIRERFQAKNIEIKILPQTKTIKTTHIGKYDYLGHAYKAILDYAKENRIELGKPTKEVYLKGPGMFMKGNPDKYITEIYVPIKE